MEKEMYKDIPGYEGIYQVSNIGNVKSLDRISKGRHGDMFIKSKILKLGLYKGYTQINLCKNGTKRHFKVHQLMAMAFLGHKPNGHNLLVDHKNNIPSDNRLENLQIITHRENVSKDTKGTSEYTGVSWSKTKNNWFAQITINGNHKYLGRFIIEHDAHLAYQKALINLR